MIFSMLLLLTVYFSEIKDINKQSGYFEKYLEKHLGVSLHDEVNYFLIFETGGCTSCSKLDLDFISELSSMKGYIIIFSTASMKLLPKKINNLLKKSNVYRDDGSYFRYNITPRSHGFIITEKMKVTNIIEMNYFSRSIFKEILQQINFD